MREIITRQLYTIQLYGACADGDCVRSYFNNTRNNNNNNNNNNIDRQQHQILQPNRR